MTQISRDDWRKSAEKALRGAEFETLVHTTEDGIKRGPLSDASDRPNHIATLPRTNTPLLDGRPWHMCASVRDPEIKFANAQLLRDLKGGASAARLSLSESSINLGANDLPRLLEGVYTDLIPLIIAPSNDVSMVERFKDYSEAHIYLGLGPKALDSDKHISDLPENWRAMTVNAARVAESGGTPAQELAYLAASTAYAYRRFGADIAAKHLGAELTSDQDAHLNIAKFRAARRIYANIAKEFGADDAQITLHAISRKSMMQSVDPWTNMLRVMSAGFGAVTGGADFITLRPFTDAIGQATPFGYRIARNMQLMMMEESHLGQVHDPAYGSYFHERMTEELAQAAWAEFQHIEADGGIENIDLFKARIKAGAEERAQNPEPILGVTLHPAEDIRKAKVREA